MRHVTSVLMLLLCVVSVSAVTFPEGYYGYDDVLLVTNNNSQDSMQISAYFKLNRNITHEVIINAPTTETITFSQFNSTIRKPIEEYLISHGLVASTNYIVTTKGVPLRFSGAPQITTSVDSALTIILSKYSYKIGTNGTGNSMNGVVMSPYTHKDKPFSKPEYDFYIVTRLTGYTIDDAENLIPPSNAQLNVGRILLDRNPTKTDGYADWDIRMNIANQAIQNKNYATLFDNTTLFVMNEGNLSGYTGWGSNDGNGPANSSKWNLTFNPGSIGETAVSTSARSFNPGTTYGQSLIADLIASGISGVKGYTDEPYLSAVAEPEYLFDAYLRGYNLADSFYIASRYLNWRDLVVGDPKMHVVSQIAPEPCVNYKFDDIKLPQLTATHIIDLDGSDKQMTYLYGTYQIDGYTDNLHQLQSSTYPDAVYHADTVKSVDYVAVITYVVLNYSESTSIIEGGQCYQEFADRSTTCGGAATGTYSIVGYDLSGGNQSKLIDGDWATGSFGYAAPLNIFTATYTIPERASQNTSQWVVGLADSINLSFNIPSTCWNNASLMLRDVVGQWAVSHNLFCYNGTGWQLLSNVSAYSNQLREEAMLWDILPSDTPSNGSWSVIETGIDTNVTQAYNICAIPAPGDTFINELYSHMVATVCNEYQVLC